MPNIETSIFHITDAIFALDNTLAYKEFIDILETNNIHYVFSSLMSTLRTFLYAERLISMSYEPSQVPSLLKIHPYAFEKMRKNMKHASQIRSLFFDLVVLDKRIKTGE